MRLWPVVGVWRGDMAGDRGSGCAEKVGEVRISAGRGRVVVAKGAGWAEVVGWEEEEVG